MSSNWYTLYSKPHKEAQLEHYLQSNGITTFYPKLKVNPVNPRASRIRGFFPRYLFVHMDLEQWGQNALQWSPGAVGLVTFGNEPAIVPEAFVAELRRRIAQLEAAGGLELAGLKAGDRVTITSGPFAGYEALFDAHLRGEERVLVLLHWLNREVKLKVNANAVEKRRSR
jgi:transcription elongation factor/antiterminator RfaH